MPFHHWPQRPASVVLRPPQDWRRLTQQVCECVSGLTWAWEVEDEMAASPWGTGAGGEGGTGREHWEETAREERGEEHEEKAKEMRKIPEEDSEDSWGVGEDSWGVGDHEPPSPPASAV